MSSDTIPSRSNGQTIDSTWFNILRTVLSQDQYPRNASAVATDQGGSLGTSTYRWLAAYLITQYLFNGSHSVALAASASLATDYTLTLPTGLPVSGSRFLLVDNTGQSTLSVDVDNSTLEVSGSTLRVKDAGITRAKLASLGQTITSSSGTFSTTSETQITNFSAAITTTGRPVFIGIISDGSGNDSYIEGASSYTIRFKRSGTNIGRHTGVSAGKLPSSSYSHIDDVAAGTYTYTITIQSASTVSVNYSKMVVYEM
jgi:hypothetical protein